MTAPRVPAVVSFWPVPIHHAGHRLAGGRMIYSAMQNQDEYPVNDPSQSALTRWRLA